MISKLRSKLTPYGCFPDRKVSNRKYYRFFSWIRETKRFQTFLRRTETLYLPVAIEWRSMLKLFDRKNETGIAAIVNAAAAFKIITIKKFLQYKTVEICAHSFA